MRLAKIHPPYSLLGRYYDQLTRESPGMNRHARKKILGRILPRVRIVCDLGCGTGTTAAQLARGGRTVYAVDASPTQCRQARKKCREAGVTVRVLCQDMRRLRLPEPIDLVLCEFNPLNHLARKGDLAIVFRKVAQALRPGGWFHFDLNMRPTYLKYYPTTRWEEHDGFGLLTRGGVDAKRERAWLELDWFIDHRGGWRRYRERIEDCWWSDREIRAALRQTGFQKTLSWDGTRIRPPKMKPRPGYDRYYLVQKSGKAS
jgi:SAM-dependent methyltransferase